MKKLIVALLVTGIFGLFSYASAFDKATLMKIAKETIRQALSGEIADIDKLIADQEKLINIGVQGCREYAKKSPKDAKMMNIIINNVDKMKSMSIDEIEEKWHDGEVLKENGIDVESMDPMGHTITMMEIVHAPATTYVVLKEYKKTGDKELLDMVKDELSDIVADLEEGEH